MRIVLKGTSAGEAVLCDGAESAPDKSRGPIGYGIEQGSATELAPGTRASAPLPLERGNVWHTLRFAVSRECASHAAAILWVNTHLQAIAAMKAAVALDQPTKTLSLVMSFGAYQKTLNPVTVGPVSAPQFIGATVSISYQITFGAWPTS